MHVEIYREKVERASLPTRALRVAEWEISRLAKADPASADYTMISNYIDYVVSLPWQLSSAPHPDISQVRQILDKNLLGLTRAKEQLLEYASVALTNPDKSLPLLCFTGAPGTGKRTLARSFATALGRDFLRVSTEEVRDDSEIRGEWRTTVGNRPGMVIRQLRECGKGDPVFLIEGIDRLAAEPQSNLISAFLEFLHPEKNRSFHDRYLNIPFDLSKVFFILTADTPYSIPDAFKNIVEIIRLPGYTNRVKLRIAAQFVTPHRLSEAGLASDTVAFAESAIEKIIGDYTMEPGVRQLDQHIASICRKLSMRRSETGETKISVTEDDVRELLGPPVIRPEMISRHPEVGIATALVHSISGAATVFIESTRMVGTGEVRITGNPPRPVREQVEQSLSYIKSHADKLEIPLDRIASSDLHIHFPDGITEEDCCSLGLAVVILMVSLFTEMPVHGEFAFSGEITLRGKVLPVDGVEEKLFSAHRSAIRKVFVSSLNVGEAKHLPDEIKSDMEIVSVDNVSQGIEMGLMKIIIPNSNLDQSLEKITTERSEATEGQ